MELKRVLLALLLCALPTPLFAAISGVAVPTSSGGGGSLATGVAINSGSTQTNVPFSLVVPNPNPYSALTGSTHVTVSDSENGTLACDENNRFSDLTPNIRGTTVSCIIPSWTGSATDTLTFTAASGSPSTGTDISIANLAATAYDVSISLTDTSGNAYTASAIAAINSGNASYVNTTTAANLGKWRSGGGIVTGFVWYSPLKHSGTSHAQLFAKGDTECYKATTGAVGGGNPILQCYTDVVIMSGVVQNASPADEWYALSITSPNGNCTTHSGATASWSTTSPTQTLTFTNTSALAETVTASSSLFTLNSIGNVVADGTGYGVITGYTSGTSATLGIYKAFASGSLTSGNYKIYPINHVYGAREAIRCYWSPSGTPSTLSVDNGDLYLGSAWNGTSGGPGSTFISSRLVLNYGTAASTMTNTPQSTTQGTNPTGYLQPATACVGQTNSCGGSPGDWQMNIETTGEAQYIGANPDVYIAALIKYDSNAASVIFQDADKAEIQPANFIDENTGLAPTMKQGTDWVTYDDVAFGGTLVATTAGVTTSINNWSNSPQNAHMWEAYYVPYILTGDWYWADSEVSLGFSQWSTGDPNFQGSQLGRTYLSDQNQARGTAWGERSFARIALVLPDSDTNSTPSTVLGWTKTDAETYLENQYTNTATGNCILETGFSVPRPGANSCFTSFASYLTPGPRFTAIGGQPGWAPWQVAYEVIAWTTAIEEGMCSTNCMNFFNWLGEGPVSLVSDTTDVPNIPGFGAEYFDANTTGLNGGGSGSTIYDWATAWKTSVAEPLSEVWDTGRIVNGTMTLSATTGSAITATIPTGYLGSGASFYVISGLGGWIHTSDGGACEITAVPTATTMTCNETASGGHAFGTTSYTNTGSSTYQTALWFIPFASPTDTQGNESTQLPTLFTSGGPTDYWTLQQTADLLIDEYGSVSGSSAAKTAAFNLTGGTLSPFVTCSCSTGTIKWNIAHR